MSLAYSTVEERLVERILALIPTHPEILTFESPWELFMVLGFDCTDLDPSLAQAAYALRKVQAERESSR